MIRSTDASLGLTKIRSSLCGSAFDRFNWLRQSLVAMEQSVIQTSSVSTSPQTGKSGCRRKEIGKEQDLPSSMTDNGCLLKYASRLDIRQLRKLPVMRPNPFLHNELRWQKRSKKNVLAGTTDGMTTRNTAISGITGAPATANSTRRQTQPDGRSSRWSADQECGVAAIAAGSLRQQPLDTVHQPIHRKRFSDIVVDTQHFGVSLVATAFIRGNHDDSNRYRPSTAEFFEH